MTTDGKSTQATADAVKMFADQAKAQYQQYLDSDVVFVDPNVVVVPTKS